jgi:glycerophosphoryl diester phosphodiesterase
VEIIGCRGAAGLEPENTLRSFRRALELGVDMVELDVHVLTSGELVVIHDEDVDRTTNGHGKVWDISFDDIRKLDAGKGEKVPTLQEVLDLIDRKVPLNIELKGPDTALPVSRVIKDYTDRGWLKTGFIVSSFRHNELRKFKKFRPDIKIAVLLDGRQWKDLSANPAEAVRLAESMNASAINPGLKFVDKELVETAHRAGLAVNAYTLIENSDVQKMADIGVDGIFANFPDRAKEVLKR